MINYNLEYEPARKPRPRRRKTPFSAYLAHPLQGWGKYIQSIFRKVGKYLAVYLSILVLLVVSIFVPLEKVSALTTAVSPPACDNNSYLSNNDWVHAGNPDALNTDQTGVKGLFEVLFPAYGVDTEHFSFVIARPLAGIAGHPDYAFAIYAMNDPSDTNRFKFVKDDSGYYLTQVKPNGGYYLNHLTARDRPDLDINMHPMVNNSHNFYITVPSSTVPQIAISCVQQVGNVEYSPTWDGPAYTTKFKNGAAEVRCDTLDIACWVSKGFKGVTDTLSSVGKAIVTTIAGFFVPTSDELKKELADFVTYMRDHLGFLMFPFDFFQSLFNQVKDNTSTGGCTDSGCVKNFGQLMHKDFVIDFAFVAEHMPSLWTMVIYATRAMVVLWLVFYIRQSYMEFMST